MGYTEATTTIHAPVEIVWASLNDIARTPDWVTGLADARLETPEPVGVGSVYTDYNRLGPFLQVTRWRVTVFEPHKLQVHESESAVLPSRMTLELSPTTAGTALRMTVEYRLLPGLGAISRALESALMNHLLQRVLRQNQASLNAYLTGREASPMQSETA